MPTANAYKNGVDEFKKLLAQSASSKSTTIIAADMMVWQPSIGFVIKNNHYDGKDHFVVGPGGARKKIGASGGYILYNDGHVEWKKAEDTLYRMLHNTNTLEFYF